MWRKLVSTHLDGPHHRKQSSSTSVVINISGWFRCHEHEELFYLLDYLDAKSRGSSNNNSWPVYRALWSTKDFHLFVYTTPWYIEHFAVFVSINPEKLCVWGKTGIVIPNLEVRKLRFRKVGRRTIYQMWRIQSWSWGGGCSYHTDFPGARFSDTPALLTRVSDLSWQEKDGHYTLDAGHVCHTLVEK